MPHIPSCNTHAAERERAQLVARYVEDVLRGEPMYPEGFVPDWDDQPWRYKIYDAPVRMALPRAWPRAGSLGSGLCGQPGAGSGAWTIEFLSTMLRYSYGLVARRLRLTTTPGQYGWLSYSDARWARGAAAGGGLYPCEIYWITGSLSGVLPGIYHYSPPHHAMNRIALGDVTGAVRDALPDDSATGSPSDEVGQATDYLLITVKLWKNSFKYADFAYHVVTMDVGCLLETWGCLAAANGMALNPRMWFEESALDELLGVDAMRESVFAVVPLGAGVTSDVGKSSGFGQSSDVGKRGAARALPKQDASEVERSTRVVRWPRLERVHEAISLDQRPPTGKSLDAAAVENGRRASGETRIPGVDRDRLDTDLTAVLRRRKSSFGRLAADPSLSASDFAAVLASTDWQARWHPELRSPTTRTTRVVTIAQHVHDVPAGVYDYDAEEHALHPVGEIPTLLRKESAQPNYNLDQAAAVVAIVARPEAFFSAAGARGYRLLNAEVGAVAQNVYMAAAALDIGCGATLGFVNSGFAPHLGLAGTDSWPMLLLMVGHERPGEADFRCSLVESVAGEE